MPKASYKNGNTTITIDTNTGTKTMFTMDDEFNLEFPTSIDFNIGNRCDGGCKFCYINASPNGVDGELLNVPLIDTLHPYTEAAINGNSIDHPQLISFLEKLKSLKVFANITVNQIHFERKEDLLRDLVDKELIKGIGISLRKATPEFVARVKKYPNAVIHTINGILTAEDLEVMRDNDLKVLILGYKNLGRGVDYKQENNTLLAARQKYLYDVLPTLPAHFKVVSFDNLALSQLNPKRFLGEKRFSEIYMGDEGSSSMFVDLVTGTYGVSSLCTPDQMHPITNNIDEMFAQVKRDAAIGNYK